METVFIFLCIKKERKSPYSASFIFLIQLLVKVVYGFTGSTTLFPAEFSYVHFNIHFFIASLEFGHYSTVYVDCVYVTAL